MSNYVLLNNVAHKNLKIIKEHSPKYGDDVMYAITFPQEFRATQGVYPIFFNKDSDTGKFYAAAIFGFRQGENLFLSENGWDANYIPISVKRRPFLIGFQNAQVDGVLKNNMVVHVDMDSPRLSETEGEPVFLPHGGNSQYLENVVSMLDYVGIGNKTGEDFIAMLLQYELLESFSLDIELKSGAQNNLTGFYTINEHKLKGLDVNALNQLHNKGYLEYIYMVLASMSNISNLIERIEVRISAIAS